jgi:hypothetical protein
LKTLRLAVGFFSLTTITMNPNTACQWHLEKAPAIRPLSNIIQRWNLDSPKNATPDDGADSLTIAGWALGVGGQHENLHVVLQTAEGTWSYPLDLKRPDVIESVLNQEPKGQKELVCGFAHQLPKALVRQGVTLGFETDGVIHAALKIRLTSQPAQSIDSSSASPPVAVP